MTSNLEEFSFKIPAEMTLGVVVKENGFSTFNIVTTTNLEKTEYATLKGSLKQTYKKGARRCRLHDYVLCKKVITGEKYTIFKKLNPFEKTYVKKNVHDFKEQFFDF